MVKKSENEALHRQEQALKQEVQVRPLHVIKAQLTLFTVSHILNTRVISFHIGTYIAALSGCQNPCRRSNKATGTCSINGI